MIMTEQLEKINEQIEGEFAECDEAIERTVASAIVNLLETILCQDEIVYQRGTNRVCCEVRSDTLPKDLAEAYLIRVPNGLTDGDSFESLVQKEIEEVIANEVLSLRENSNKLQDLVGKVSLAKADRAVSEFLLQERYQLEQLEKEMK